MKTNFKGFVSLREPAKSKNKQTKKNPHNNLDIYSLKKKISLNVKDFSLFSDNQKM